MYRSGRQEEGVPRFEFFPVTAAGVQQVLPMLVPGPIEVLEKELLRRFAGQTLSVAEIYEAYGVGTPYVKPNHQEALRRLEERGLIKCDPSRVQRPMQGGKMTMGDRVLVKFP